jgi:uncharacterized protein YcbK (DUF882 family)
MPYSRFQWLKWCSRVEPRASTVRAAIVAAVLALAIALPSAASANRQHTVKGGQTLTSIAKQYGVTPWSLAAANHLEPTDALRLGQVLDIPEKGVVYVNAGQTLWSVARRHGCTVEALARTNGLKTTSSLRPGMRLMLPGQKAAGGEGGGTERSWGAPKHPGRVSLVRAGTGEKLTVTLVDARGRVRPEAAKQLQRFLKPHNSPQTKSPERRLLGLLARVSDHFGGRTIHVVSGYRLAVKYTSHESRHVKGAAIDLHIEGVPNRALRDHLRLLDDVGVGFYPNSSFIHFDVRSENAYWVDLSGPGQKPTYLTRDQRDSFEDEKAREKDLAIVGDTVDEALEELEHEEPGAAEVTDE